MSRIAIISDIHANIHALDLVLNDISTRNVDKIICLGDVVTKYFHPKEVIKEVRDNCAIVIKGNCDDLVSKNKNYKFVRGEIGIDGIDYLDNLPRKEQIELNKVLLNFFHSNPNDLESIFNPLFNDNKNTSAKDRTIPTSDFNKMFVDEKPQITFVGHTHNNYIGIVKGHLLDLIEENQNQTGIFKEATINPDQRAIVNVGSAGEHTQLYNENGKYTNRIDPFLTYAIVENNEKTNDIKVQMVKVPYKRELIRVFKDFKNFQKMGIVGPQPNDTKKIHDSLIDMGYSDDEIGGIKL